MNIRNLIIIIMLLSVLAFIPAGYQQVLAGADPSLDLAQQAKEKVDRAAGSLKKGFQPFGEKIGEVGSEIYKIKNEIDQYVEAGQWENLPKGEKALLLARSLDAIGKLELAFSENLEDMLKGMETYENAVGEAIVATTHIKGANKDAEYFVQKRLKTIKHEISQNFNDPSIRDAKEKLKSSECKEKTGKDPECRRALQKIQNYRLKLASWTREIKMLNQKRRLAEMNQQLVALIHGRLRNEGPLASSMFRQVIDTWVELSVNMELLRNLPTDAITGEEGEDKTRKLITLGENMTKMGGDLVEMITMTVDSVVNNLGQVSGVAVTGGARSTESIIESAEAAEENLARLVGE